MCKRTLVQRFLTFFVHSIPDVCIERLQEEFNQLDCTDQQKDRMEEFFKSKRAVGELRQDDLIHICELGQGNGGVVSKVSHKPTGKIMARKVTNYSIDVITVTYYVRLFFSHERLFTWK